MLYGSTDIRVIQDGARRVDLEPILEQLRALPGVVAAEVAWENEGKLDDWEVEMADAARGKTANPNYLTLGTFAEAQRTILEVLETDAAWEVDRSASIPHATSPDGKCRAYFRPRTIWVSAPPFSLRDARKVDDDPRHINWQMTTQSLWRHLGPALQKQCRDAASQRRRLSR